MDHFRIGAAKGAAPPFSPPGTHETTLADTRGSEHEDILVIGSPRLFLRQPARHALVQPARCTIVDVFDAGALQPGGVQPPRQRLT